MVTGEFHSYQEAEEDPFEAEETLSLSDLPISGDSSQSDDSYSKYEDDDDDGFFEFFSEDFTAETRSTTVEKDIIFCGRIINAYEGESKKNDAKQSKSLNPWFPNKSDPKSDVASDYSVGWYLYTFGMSSMKSPPEMDVPATATKAFPVAAGGKKSQGRRKSWWLGKMLRSLGSGCRNSGIVLSTKTTP